jgi:ribonuclease Z
MDRPLAPPCERTYPRFFYPGEPLAVDEMRVTVLGSGGPFTRPGQAAPSMLVELGDGQILIMDIGSGAFANLNSLQIPQSRIEKVFLTHLHCDHWSDLTHLHAINTVYGRRAPLQVWGPSGPEERYGTAAFGRAFVEAMAWDIASRRGKAARGDAHEIAFHEFDYRTPAWIYDEDDLRIKAFPALHCFDGPVSYRLEWNDLAFVFAGDTKPNAFFVEHGQEADLMVYETFPPAELYSRRSGLPLWATRNVVNGVHSPPRAAGKVFDLTRPRLPVMYHLRMATEDREAVIADLRHTYDGPVVIAEDLMVFNVSADSVVARQAVTPDQPDPVVLPDDSSEDDRYDPDANPPISRWLLDAEIRVEGVDYPGDGTF